MFHSINSLYTAISKLGDEYAEVSYKFVLLILDLFIGI